MNAENQYDIIAKEYDSLFKDSKSIQENKAIAEMLQGISGTILDIGCGTGLLLDLINIRHEDYFGIDASGEMLRIFRQKHLRHDVLQISFEMMNIHFMDFSNFISLFGSSSYILPEALSVFPRDKKLFLMFYREGYHPVTYEKTKHEFFHYVHTKEELQQLFPDCEIKDFSNYYIVTNL